jgi:hypothetical protein
MSRAFLSSVLSLSLFISLLFRLLDNRRTTTWTLVKKSEQIAFIAIACLFSGSTHAHIHAHRQAAELKVNARVRAL